jgi:hypothetical protein
VTLRAQFGHLTNLWWCFSSFEPNDEYCFKYISWPVSEVVLCNELRMPVSMVCFCDNYANGITDMYKVEDAVGTDR